MTTDEPRDAHDASTGSIDMHSAYRSGSRAGAWLEEFNRPITIAAALTILFFDRVVAPTMVLGAAYVTVVLLSPVAGG